MKTRLLQVLASIPLFAQVPTLPYSAVQVSETTQTLADGTHIKRGEQKILMYRDSQGRTRTEMIPSPPPDAPATLQFPHMININDPVAGVHYMLDVNTDIARRTQLPKVVTGGTPSSGPNSIMIVRTPSAQQSVPLPAPPLSPNRPQIKREPVGTQVVEGLFCDGYRTVTTYPANSFGNDREIVATSEVWISQELKVQILIKNSDPRFGERVTRLTEINRIEPDPALFVPPPDYKIEDQPALAPSKQ